MKNFYAVALLCVSIVSSMSLEAQKAWDGGAGNNSWNAANNWNPNGIPAATDAVTIGNGFTVVLDVTATVASLTVGGGVSGTLTLGNGGVNDNLTVTGNISINSGATMTRADDGILTVGGNITNNGSFIMAGGSDYNIVFNGAANQTLGGTGATTSLNLVTINNSGGANNNIVEITSTAFAAPTDFLTLTDGILKVSGNFSFSNTFFSAAGYNINAASGLWINNPNATVLGQNGNPNIDGLIQLSAGTYNVGTTISNALVLDNGSSLIVEGGTMNIAGRLSALAVDVVSIDISGGTINLSTAGNSSATANTFQVMNPSSTFTMSGGTIIIHRSNSNASGRDYENIATATITGGTVQFGSAGTPAANDDFDIGSTVAGNHVIPSMVIVDNASSVPTVTITTPASSVSSLAIRGNVSIGAGTSFLPNSQNISVTGNWTNDGTFTSGTQTTTFNGSALQTISGVNASSFSGVTVSNTGAGLTLTRNIAVSGVLTLTDGVVTTAPTPNGMLALGSGASIAGGGSPGAHINGPLSKFGSTDFTFPTGNGTLFRPITVSSITGGNAAITARYIQGNPQTTVGSALGPGVNHIGVCEYWDLDDGTASVSAIVSLEFGASCNALPYADDPATLLVAHWNGTQWEDLGNSAATATSVTAALTSGLSPFTIGSSSVLNPLPVLFSGIKAFEKQNGIQVEWTAYQEFNLGGYDVERSPNGTVFTKIGSVTALNSTSEVTYQFLDMNPYPAVNFYRIVSRDVDGKPGFSNIVKVNLDKSVKEITVYPNPVRNGYVSFQSSDLAKGNYLVRVINTNGVVLTTRQFNHSGGALTQTFQLPSTLPAGMYTMQVITDGRNLFIRSFLVQ